MKLKTITFATGVTELEEGQSVSPNRRIPIAIGSRIYEHMWNVQVGWAMHILALHSTKMVKIEHVGDAELHLQIFISWQTEKSIVIPINGVFESAVLQKKPPVIWYEMRAQKEEFRINTDSPGAFTIGTGGPMASIMDATFSLFVERCNEWLKKEKKNTSYHSWPPVSNFCRVVRNAIVHGGKINIDSPTAARVEWRNLSYDHKQNGRSIYQDLSDADFIHLALELDAEMDLLGAPALL